MKTTINIILTLIVTIFMVSCSESTSPDPESANISIKINYTQPQTKQDSIDRVDVTVLDSDSMVYKEIPMEINDSTATGSVNLDFGRYSFIVEMFSSSQLMYYGEKYDKEVNISTTTVTIEVSAVSEITLSQDSLNFGDVTAGEYSHVDSLLLTGTNIYDSITVSCTSGFEISKTNNSLEFNGEDLFYYPDSGYVEDYIYIRGITETEGLLNGTLTCSSDDINADDAEADLLLNGTAP